MFNSSDKPKLLIISKNIEYPRLFQVLATKLGVIVVPVKGTGDDLAKLDTISPDLIVMDWLDQQKDRSLCVQRIRKWNESSQNHTPILTVTGHTDANLQACLDEQMDDYLAMPFSFEQLLGKLTYWLAERG